MPDAREVYTTHPTPEEIAEVLEQRELAALGTLNEDGSIHLVYMLFLHHAGRLYFETSSVTRKARNVAARGRASLLVQGRASTGRSLMVSAEGTARMLDGDRARGVNHRVLTKYVKADALDGIARSFGTVDDVAIEITPERWRSWTNTRLRELAETEIGAGNYGDVWQEDD
jgi:PPOX class probable F420-dependent enzyme